MAKKKRPKNRLSKNDAELFVTLYLSLLQFVNQREGIIKDEELVALSGEKLIEKWIEIRDVFWENEDYFLEFVEVTGGGFPDRILSILKSWFFRVDGLFVVAKHYKNYSLLFEVNDPQRLFGVVGLSKSIEESIPSSKLPVYVKTSVLPFEDKMVIDELVYLFPPLPDEAQKKLVSVVDEAIETQPVITDLTRDVMPVYMSGLDEESFDELVSNFAEDALFDFFDGDSAEEFPFNFYKDREVKPDSTKSKKPRKK